jgi:hypothetical protein
MPNNIQAIRSQRTRWAGHVAHIEDNRNAYRVSVRKTEEVRSIGRSRCRWKYNIKTYLEEIGWDSFDRCNILGSIKCRVSPF